MKRFLTRFLSIGLSVFLIILSLSSVVYAENIKPYSGDFDLIAYSKVDGIKDAPINTAEHFLKCCSEEYPFTTLKGDLRVTADNQIVMCHDKGVTLNSSGRIVSYKASNSVNIHNLTYEQCMALQYDKKYNDEYVSVCDFETFIKICSEHNKNAYITIRDEYIPELLDVMMPLIYKYDMQEHCMVNSFTLESLKLVKEYDDTIPLSWVIKEGKLTNDIIDKAGELGNCLITLFNFPTKSYGGLEGIENYKEQIKYAQEKGVLIYAAIIESISYVDELRRYGISGAQIINLRTLDLPPIYSRWAFRKIEKKVTK